MPCPFRPRLWNRTLAFPPKPIGQSKPRGQARHAWDGKEHMSCGDGGGEGVVTEQQPILAPYSSLGQSRQALDESPGLPESFSVKAGYPCAPQLRKVLRSLTVPSNKKPLLLCFYCGPYPALNQPGYVVSLLHFPVEKTES